MVGYIRVSSIEQNVSRQLDGIRLDRTFTEKASGKNTQRPQLELMLAFVREGDTVVVHSLDRLARNLDDLRRIVLGLTAKGVSVRFEKERLDFTGEDSPMANLLLSVMGAFAEFERSLILERQKEGISIAKAEGKYRGGVARLKPEQVAALRQRIKDGVSIAAVAREFGLSRQSVYSYQAKA